jgi:ankyrin repeat protein
MGEREANGGPADEYTSLMKMEESVGEEIELQNITTADSSAEIVTGMKGNTAANQSLPSVFQETDTNAVSNRDTVVSMARQETQSQPLAHHLYRDNYTGDNESTMREIIMQMYPDLQPFLIHNTAGSGNLELLEMLLGKGKIDVNVKDNEDRTILHWWARVSEKNPNDKETLETCFKLILEKGFDIKRSFKDKDSSGNTPFSTAVDHKHRDRIILMLDSCSDNTVSAHIDQALESADK